MCSYEESGMDWAAGQRTEVGCMHKNPLLPDIYIFPMFPLSKV